MQGFVMLFAVSLLKKDIGADACFFQQPVVLHRSGGYVDIHPADGSVFVMDAVNGADGLQDIVDRVVSRVLSGFQGKAFMPHVLQGDNLAAYLLLREFLAGNGTVLGMIRAIDATVHAIVGKIKRGKHHDAVTIEFLFDFACQMEDALHQSRLVTFQQQGCFPMGKTLAQSSLVNQTFDERTVVAVYLRIL